MTVCNCNCHPLKVIHGDCCQDPWAFGESTWLFISPARQPFLEALRELVGRTRAGATFRLFDLNSADDLVGDAANSI